MIYTGVVELDDKKSPILKCDNGKKYSLRRKKGDQEFLENFVGEVMSTLGTVMGNVLTIDV